MAQNTAANSAKNHLNCVYVGSIPSPKNEGESEEDFEARKKYEREMFVEAVLPLLRGSDDKSEIANSQKVGIVSLMAHLMKSGAMGIDELRQFVSDNKYKVRNASYRPSIELPDRIKVVKNLLEQSGLLANPSEGDRFANGISNFYPPY